MGMGRFMNQGDFSIKGYSSHDAMTEFVDGTYKITNGSMFDQDDSTKKCIISSELAKENSLSVGSKIVFTNPKNENETFEATISGIYENNDSTSAEGITFGGADPANTIFMSYNSVKALINESSKNPITVTDSMTNTETTSVLTSRTSGTYVLSDVASYEAFQKDAEKMGLDTSIYSVSSLDVSQYEQSTAPLDNLSRYTMVFFLVVLGIGALILVVFNLFTIKTRKYEIGVLSAIGMNKAKVAMQFVTESLVIALIAAVLGAGIGAASSAPIADKLLTNQVTTVQETAQSQPNNFGGNFQRGKNNGGPMGMAPSPGNGNMAGRPGQSVKVNYIDSISTSTDFTVIAELIGVCLLLTVLSSGIAMISILRYDPLKILSDRV